MIVAGGSSFVGGHILEAARGRLPAMAVDARAWSDDLVTPDDVVVTCALHPAYRSEPYEAAFDIERSIAESAARGGAKVIMLSTRRVYPAACRWGARESDPAPGDETRYGQNKARTEQAVLASAGDNARVLRLSNVFGFEYQSGATARTTFFGMMLSRLRGQGEIYLDVAPATRRDFIPVDWAATAVVSAALVWRGGILNIGAGGAVSCGEIAEQVIAGYGSGVLRCADGVRDEFYLDTSKWLNEFGVARSSAELLAAARLIGEKLQNA